MAQSPGYYGPAITEEFYSNYSASLLNSIQGDYSVRMKKQAGLKLALKDHGMM